MDIFEAWFNDSFIEEITIIILRTLARNLTPEHLFYKNKKFLVWLV